MKGRAIVLTCDEGRELRLSPHPSGRLKFVVEGKFETIVSFFDRSSAEDVRDYLSDWLKARP